MGIVMTPNAQRLVRDSFAKIAPKATIVAAMFYERLFVLDPTLRPLFKGDMAEQGTKLMGMIGTAVGNLHRLHAILPTVQDLGRRQSVMASSRRTIRRSPRRCFGHSNKVLVASLPRKPGKLGPNATRP
jgi:Globin